MRELRQGFTLTEVMIATFLVTVALLAWIGLQSFFFKSSLKYREKQKAAAVAQTVIDTVIYNLEDDWDNGNIERNLPPLDPDYSYEVSITDAGTPYNSTHSCKRIKVTVHWTYKGETDMEYVLVTRHQRAAY